MKTQRTLRQMIVTNLIWLIASLVLAFVVWMLAVSQSDPFETWRVSNLPIHVAPDEGLIITNQSDISSTAWVQLRAQRSVHQLFASDDVVVVADLSGLGPGEHTVQLDARLARQASVVGISPRQITVALEVEESQLKPVTVNITSQPPLVYSVGEPQVDPLQVQVSGPESRVAQVVEVDVLVSLDGQRSTFEDDVRLVPVDADGNTVTGVTLNPQTVHVSVPVEARSDVREVRVQPNITGELAEGYVLTRDFDYNPKSVVVKGPASVLANLPGTFFTAPISLSDKTSSFSVTVPVELPDSRLTVVTGRTVTVTVGIETQTVTRQFDHIAVEFIGSKTELEYHTVTTEVTVLVTGPQPLLNQLSENDLSVLVDVSDLASGESVQLAPLVSITDGVDVITTSVLPALIDVEARPLATVEPVTG